jgi:hypothetical protein
MMLLKRSFSFIVAGSLACALLLCASARAAQTTPAITAFDAAFAAINDYTCQIKAHEVKGSNTQNRVYQYSFLKPTYAKTLILSGDGQGSGGVWSGGDTVSGHQGGILAGIHLNVDLHDPRATSMLGYTIPDGLLQNIVGALTQVPGTLTQAPGGKINGELTDRVDLKASGSLPNGVTEMVVYFSQATHWPLREISYAGSQIIVDQSITDLKTNTGLSKADF